MFVGLCVYIKEIGYENKILIKLMKIICQKNKKALKPKPSWLRAVEERYEKVDIYSNERTQSA